MKFGEKVRDLRKKHSLTQDELAQCLGINKRTIIGWERDGRYPRSIEMLEKMADIFHVPLTYLQPDQSLFIERAAEAYQSPAGQTDKADGVRLCARTLSGASAAYGLAYPEQVSDH